MRRLATSMAASVLLATPAFAQTVPVVPPSWIDDGRHSPQPKLADIGVPRAAGPLKLKAFTDTGSARDTIAQYATDDGQIQATIYLYQNGAPDALLAKIATDRAVTLRFGASTDAGPDTIFALAGKPGTGLRSDYANGSAPPGFGLTGPVTTASVFAHTQFTVIKVRITGPDQRRKDVLDGLNSLVAGLDFRKRDQPLPVSRASLPPCPGSESDGIDAVAIDRQFPADAATAAGMNLMGGEPRAAAILGRQACIVASPADSTTVILRGAGREEGVRIMLWGDAGTTVTVKALPELDPAGRPFLALYSTRATALYGPFDRTPTVSQLSSLAKGDAGWLGSQLAKIGYDAGGNFKITINTGRMKADPAGAVSGLLGKTAVPASVPPEGERRAAAGLDRIPMSGG